METIDSSQYEVVFIGGGLASTITLIRFIEANQTDAPAPMRVVMVDDAGDFAAGLAYGKRGGAKSLIITDLSEFCPSPERERFCAWLVENERWILDDFTNGAGAVTAKWIADNGPAIAAGDFDGVFLPRYLFGLYLKDRLETLIAGNRWLETSFIVGSAVEIASTAEGYRVKVSGDEISPWLHGRFVILGLGSPPFRRLFGVEGDDRIIESIYEPGVDECLAQTRRALEVKPGDVVLVGANATALDAVFNLSDTTLVDSLVNTYHLLSPQGHLPATIVAGDSGNNFAPENLLRLAGGQVVRPPQILQALSADLELAGEEGLTSADVFGVVNEAASQARASLDDEGLLEFAEHTGAAIGRLQRRAGHEYSNLAETLEADDRLVIHAGTMTSLDANQSGLLVHFEDSDGLQRSIDAAVIINCTGMESLGPESSSPLLRSLEASGLGESNRSGRGIVVNDDLEAAPNLFVNGPMLAGNVIDGRPIWHVEHCGRILQFGQQIADILFSRICATGRSSGKSTNSSSAL